MKLGGDLQNDTAGYVNTESAEELLGAEINGGVEWRRARLYAEGRILRHLDFKLRYDFTAGNPANLKDAYFSLVNLPLPTAGLTAGCRAPTTSAGPARFAWAFTKGKTLVHLGADFWRRNVSDTIQFATRPESHLAPYFVDSGDVPADHSDVTILEAALQPGGVTIESGFGLARIGSTGALDDWSAAFNWYPTYHLRLMLNAILANPGGAKPAGIFQMRMQVAF